MNATIGDRAARCIAWEDPAGVAGCRGGNEPVAIPSELPRGWCNRFDPCHAAMWCQSIYEAPIYGGSGGSMLEKLISELSDILECDKHAISADTHFKELEQWDSLAHVSTVSMIDDVFDTVLSEDEIKRVSTVADLASLVESKIQA